VIHYNYDDDDGVSSSKRVPEHERQENWSLPIIKRRGCVLGWVVAVLWLLLSPRAASCPPHLAEASEPFSDCHYQSLRHDLARYIPFAHPAQGHISWSWKASLKQPPCTGCCNLLTGMPLPQVTYLPQHQIPIQERHHVSLHEVHGKSLFALVKREGFQGLSVVVKLRENHTVVASHQWTRRVAIILWLRQSWKAAFFHVLSRHLGFPGDSDGKESAWQCRRCRFNTWVGKIPWRQKGQPTAVFLPGKFHGWRSLAGYSPWGHKKSDTTERPNNNHLDILELIIYSEQW